MIMNPTQGRFQEKVSDSPKNKSVRLLMEIPFDAWKEGDARARESLLGDALLRGLGRVESSKIAEDVKAVKSAIAAILQRPPTLSEPVAMDTTSDVQISSASIVKLYKSVNGALNFHEAWIDHEEVIEHWGTVGERGSVRRHPLGKERSLTIEGVLAAPIKEGYERPKEADYSVIQVQYSIKGKDVHDQLKRRHALEDRLNQVLGWTGLGHCEGGSMGQGSMEVDCAVIDSEIGQRTIEQSLRDTEFSDYVSIRPVSS
jgi:hypothetical protein